MHISFSMKRLLLLFVVSILSVACVKTYYINRGELVPGMYSDAWTEDTVNYYISCTVTYNQAEFAFIKKNAITNKVMLWEDAIYSAMMFKDWLDRYQRNDGQVSFKFGNNMRMRWEMYEGLRRRYLSSSPFSWNSRISRFIDLTALVVYNATPNTDALYTRDCPSIHRTDSVTIPTGGTQKPAMVNPHPTMNATIALTYATFVLMSNSFQRVGSILFRTDYVCRYT